MCPRAGSLFDGRHAGSGLMLCRAYRLDVRTPMVGGDTYIVTAAFFDGLGTKADCDFRGFQVMQVFKVVFMTGLSPWMSIVPLEDDDLMCEAIREHMLRWLRNNHPVS